MLDQHLFKTSLEMAAYPHTPPFPRTKRGVKSIWSPLSLAESEGEGWVKREENKNGDLCHHFVVFDEEGNNLGKNGYKDRKITRILLLRY